MKEVNKIYQTEDYDKFGVIVGNRAVDINSAAFIRLCNSIKTSGQLMPGMVTPDFKIIDGQNRLLACQKENKPFYFFIVDIDESKYGPYIQLVNTLSDKWTGLDYLNYYCKNNIVNYNVVKDLMNLYHGVSLTTIMSCLDRNVDRQFKTGNLKRIDLITLNRAKKVLDILGLFSKEYSFTKTKRFILALKKIIENEDFNLDTFIDKLSKNPSKLKICKSEIEYIRLLEDIYNHGSSNKVRFY